MPMSLKEREVRKLKNAGFDDNEAELVQVVSSSGAQVDAVWGNVGDEGATNYRSLTWVRATVLEVKLQIGLGILSVPSVLHTLGFVPGILVLVLIAIMTGWSNYVVGRFKLNHPEVYTVADVGYLIFGPFGREIWGVAYMIYLVATSGSSMLGMSIALNAMSEHGTCTLVFVVVSAVLVGLVSGLPTLQKISWISWVGLIGIMASLITLAISVGVSDRPAAAPKTGPWDPDVHAIGSPQFIDAMNAVGTSMFAYAASCSYFNVVAEMRDPREYTKSIICAHTFITITYLVLGSIIYHFAGQYVSSPALGSAGDLMKKVCYGIAFPGLLAGAVLNTHMPAKFIFVRLLRGTHHLSSNTVKHHVVWVSCVVGVTAIAFIIAEAIPFFDSLVSLVGSLLAGFLSVFTMGVMWIWDNPWNNCKMATARPMLYKFLYFWSIWMIIGGLFIMVGGTYSNSIQIHRSLNDGSTVSPFSCADNSGS